MKLGKLPENVLKRSILKKLDLKRSDASTRPEFGEYCAFLRSDGGYVVLSEGTVSDSIVNSKYFLVHKLVNNLACKNATATGIMFSVTIPEAYSEQQLKDLIAEINKASTEANIPVIDINSRVSANVTEAIVSATVTGSAAEPFKGKATPGDDVVVTKWVGLEGTSVIAKLKEAELQTKFPTHLIYDASNFDRFASIVPEAATAIKSGASAVYSLSEGGIFAGLWELAGVSGVGLDIVLRDIPIKQETIEICNFYDLNPYGLFSGGSLLITAPDGNGLVMELNKIGIDAVIIGKCTDSNDKVIINDEIRRFIEPAKQDEIYRIL